MPKAWHVSTERGEVYGAACETAGEARKLVADRIAEQGTHDGPTAVRRAGRMAAPYGAVIHYGPDTYRR